MPGILLENHFTWNYFSGEQKNKYITRYINTNIVQFLYMYTVYFDSVDYSVQPK